MSSLLADLRFSLRTLVRSPLFAIVAILSLGLGIGANTAIFTLLDQILLRKLPAMNTEGLVMLVQRGAHNGSNMGDRMHSYPLYRDFQQKAPQLAEVLCRRTASASISVGTQTERVAAELVSGNYFSMLGVKPAAGRLFTSKEDDQVYNGHPVVVISHAYWQERFQGNPKAVGQKILVNNVPMTIVGVSAEGFAGLDPTQSPRIRIPILMKPALIPEWTFLKMDDRRTRWVQVFARLKPGYTAASAQPGLNQLFLQQREYEMTLPEAKDWTEYARTQFRKGSLRVDDADKGYSNIRNSFSTALIVLMCMVGLVLLIACANVANLLIARSFARQKEFAVRLSVGASRGQLMQQLLVESLLLSFAGGALGLLLAVAMTRGMLALIPAEGSPLLINASPDWRILAFTFGLTLVTGLVFGLLPAMRASRLDLWTTLKDTVGAIAGQTGSQFLRKGLVAAQVALSFLLLFGAGLFVRSLQNLKTAETGFRNPERLVTFQVSPALSGYTIPRAMQFNRDLQESLKSTPGVTSASLASVPLLRGWEWDSTMSVEGHQAKDGEDMSAFMNAFAPDYFATMGITLVQGRDFVPSDQVTDAKVAIVNQSFANHFFPGQSPLGRKIGQGSGPKAKLNVEIIGVVADTMYEGIREGVHRQVFVPFHGNSGVAFYVRATTGAAETYNAIRAQVRKLDAAMPIYEMKTLAGQLDETLMTERLIAMLSAGFGLLATLLAAVGLYGVMAFAVARRTKELGVRLALGAQPNTVIWLVMKEVLQLLAIGLLVGMPAAYWLGQYVSAQLYGLQSADITVGSSTLFVLAVVSAMAGFIPAYRASQIDPVLALRCD